MPKKLKPRTIVAHQTDTKTTSDPIIVNPLAMKHWGDYHHKKPCNNRSRYAKGLKKKENKS